MNYAVLDYDGFICKSFYAAHRDEVNAQIILDDLTHTALDKAERYFDGEKFKAYLIVSGHSWKKDLYSDYKKSREKDPYVGAYRDYIIETVVNVIKPTTLEADELCVMVHDYAVANSGKCVVFSDDKDLRYSTLVNCKVNLGESIEVEYNEKYLYEQMIAGDKEDDITGIPRIGMKTAEKLLEDNGYNIEGVIKTYKDKEVPLEDCIKNLNLIIPMKREFNKKVNCYDELCRKFVKDYTIDEYLVKHIQIGQLDYLTETAKGIYG